MIFTYKTTELKPTRLQNQWEIIFYKKHPLSTILVFIHLSGICRLENKLHPGSCRSYYLLSSSNISKLSLSTTFLSSSNVFKLSTIINDLQPLNRTVTKQCHLAWTFLKCTFSDFLAHPGQLVSSILQSILLLSINDFEPVTTLRI